MIHEKLKAIEDKINESSSMKQENKESVLELLSELKSEIQDVSSEQTDQIAQLDSLKEIQQSTDEDAGLIKKAFNEVSDSVKSFEESHPKLVQLVNSICTQLSNAGL